MRSLKSTLLAASVAILAGSYSPVLFADDRPLWVVSPERNGFISVVGYALKQPGGGAEVQRRVALMKARQQLGQIVRVRVENNSQQETQVKNGKATQSVESSTRLSSHATLNLNNAEVNAQWLDPANGDLYLLLELPEEVIGNH